LYSSSRNTSAFPSETIRYASFDAVENPQILFAVMLVGAYAISRQQHDAYVRYRQSYPATYRLAVHKAKWLHRLGAISIGLLVLFYFVPTATWIVGIRVFVSGFAYWVLSIAFAVLMGFGTRAYYSGQVARAAAAENEETHMVVKKVAI